MNYVKEYNIDLSKYPEGTTEDEFNSLVEEGIMHLCDLVPYDDKDYKELVIHLGISWADSYLDPQSELNQIASYHDEEESTNNNNLPF